ncbi:MAG: rubrerythrin family protein [Clostridia bacterium]|nr:rubrerythrin family protein [Clostridia bacterium]
MEFSGSRTQANLTAAFASECQARTKYDIFASCAQQDGYRQIADIFKETANNERVHAQLWMRTLRNQALPATVDALREAADGERYEWADMYEEFARVADEEGFSAIASAFRLVGAIEKAHEARYRQLIDNLESGAVFKRDVQTVWICLNCGHLHTGDTPPDTCPVCGKPQAYFELHIPNY